MPLEQKMEIAIRGAPLSKELQREIGSIDALIESFLAIAAVLAALTLTGFGAVAEVIGLSLLLAGAAASGVQIGRGLTSFMDFYRRVDGARTEADLERAGVSFADGVAAIGVGTLFLLLTILGARARGGSGIGTKGSSVAAEETGEMSSRAPPRRRPPDLPKREALVDVLDKNKLAKNLANKMASDVKSHPLRQAYEAEVKALAAKAKELQAQGMPRNEIAKALSQARREIGVKYKDSTPEPLREYIYDLNRSRYGDPLGRTYEDLKALGKTDTEIIESASRPNRDVNDLLGGFEDWLKSDKNSKQFFEWVRSFLPGELK
jgi:hypothetical protein